MVLAMAAFLIGPEEDGLAKRAVPKPSKITLNVTAKTLTVGQKFTAKVKSVKPARASKKVSWSSSKKTVATITGKGVVKAIGPGATVITAKSVVRASVKRKFKVTVKKAAVVIDPKLLGSWGLFTSGAGSVDTFNADGTWNSIVIFEGPLLPLQQYSKGDYKARNGKIYYSNVVFRSRKDEDEPWSAWKPAAEPNRIENYEVGVDEYGDYLMTEQHPDPVTPESVKYRRSE
jgi:hypothetical protein